MNPLTGRILHLPAKIQVIGREIINQGGEFSLLSGFFNGLLDEALRKYIERKEKGQPRRQATDDFATTDIFLRINDYLRRHDANV